MTMIIQPNDLDTFSAGQEVLNRSTSYTIQILNGMRRAVSEAEPRNIGDLVLAQSVLAIADFLFRRVADTSTIRLWDGLFAEKAAQETLETVARQAAADNLTSIATDDRWLATTQKAYMGTDDLKDVAATLMRMQNYARTAAAFLNEPVTGDRDATLPVKDIIARTIATLDHKLN